MFSVPKYYILLKKNKSCHKQNRKALWGDLYGLHNIFWSFDCICHPFCFLYHHIYIIWTVLCFSNILTSVLTLKDITGGLSWDFTWNIQHHSRTRSPFSLMTRGFDLLSLNLPVLYSELSHAKRWKGLRKKMWADSVTCITICTSLKSTWLLSLSRVCFSLQSFGCLFLSVIF